MMSYLYQIVTEHCRNNDDVISCKFNEGGHQEEV